jgi:hypothetical protein
MKNYSYLRVLKNKTRIMEFINKLRDRLGNWILGDRASGTYLSKFDVCDQCWSVGMIVGDCVCSHDRYETIELEFEVCKCCNNLVMDGSPAETEFNKEQLEKRRQC